MASVYYGVVYVVGLDALELLGAPVETLAKQILVSPGANTGHERDSLATVSYEAKQLHVSNGFTPKLHSTPAGAKAPPPQALELSSYMR